MDDNQQPTTTTSTTTVCVDGRAAADASHADSTSMSEVVGTTPAQLAAAVAAIIAAIPSTTDYSRSGGCPERDGTCGCSNRQEEGKEAWQQEEQCSGREWRWRRSRSEEDKGMQFR